MCLPISCHIRQSGGKVIGLLLQENHSDCSRVAQHALVLGSSGHGKPHPSVPSQSADKSFNQIPNRNLLNLNLHAWLLKPQL